MEGEYIIVDYMNHEGNILSGDILGMGIDGVVCRLTDTSVMKVPKIRSIRQEDGTMGPWKDHEIHIDDLDREKQAYRRLGQPTPGIARCLDILPRGISLQYYARGNLKDYIQSSKKPGTRLKLSWITSIVNAIATCHNANILVFDVALRNFVLSDSLEVHLIDFANSTILEEHEDICTANECGGTLRLDLYRLGCVLYSVSSWKIFEIEAGAEEEWPPRSELPTTSQLPLGLVIERCWRGEYKTIRQVQEDIKVSARRRAKLKHRKQAVA